MHDAGKVALGNIPSSVKDVGNYKGPMEAGYAVRLKSDQTLSVASADGSLIGISLGRDLSGTDRAPVAKAGLSIPLRLTASFTPVVGAKVHVSNTTGMAGTAGAGFTETKAIYASAVLEGIGEDGASVDVALVDAIGGL